MSRLDDWMKGYLCGLATGLAGMFLSHIGRAIL